MNENELPSIIDEEVMNTTQPVENSSLDVSRQFLSPNDNNYIADTNATGASPFNPNNVIIPKEEQKFF